MICGLLLVSCLALLSSIQSTLSPDLGQYILTQFEKDESARQNASMAKRGNTDFDMNFVSSSPFVTANGFRALCYPNVVDYNFSSSIQCTLSVDMFRAVPSGACVYVASACFEKVVNMYLSQIPGTFTLVVHDGDQSIPGKYIFCIYYPATIHIHIDIHT